MGMKSEAATVGTVQMVPGDPVQVVRGISRVERGLLGRVFVLQRYSSPRGYAVLIDANDKHVMVHPESLDIYSGPEL